LPAVEILDALDRDRKRFLREIRVTAQLEPGSAAESGGLRLLGTFRALGGGDPAL
jgi:hypothetical protein